MPSYSPQKYEGVESDDLRDRSYSEVPFKWRKAPNVYAIAIVTIVFVIGVAVGRLFSLNWKIEIDGFPEQLGNMQTVWYLNRTFAEKPNPESEAAWQSIIPEGKGFIKHPILAPNNKSLSLFHELHCLHTIRVAYYISIHDSDALRNSSYSDPYLESMKTRTSLSHVEHCFDYVRQALMCAADTNFEEPNKNGVTDGWGIQRQCRDYWRILEWAERWKNNNHTMI